MATVAAVGEGGGEGVDGEEGYAVAVGANVGA